MTRLGSGTFFAAFFMLTLVRASVMASEFFSYSFRAGSSVQISDRLEGSVTVTGMGLTMNGTFDLAVESFLKVLKARPDGSADMEAEITRLKGGIQFPITGLMRIDTAQPALQEDLRVKSAGEAAKSWVGRKLRFTVDNQGRVSKASSPPSSPPGKTGSAQNEAGLKGLAQAYFLILPEPAPAAGQSWDPLPRESEGFKAELRVDRVEKGFAFFKAQFSSDLGAAAKVAVVPETLPQAQSTRAFLDGMSGAVTGSAVLSYSNRDGLPAPSSGASAGKLSFQLSKEPGSPATTADFSLSWTRTRGALPKP